MSSDIATAEFYRSTKAGLIERKQGGDQISLSAVLLLSSHLHAWAEDVNLSAMAEHEEMWVNVRARRRAGSTGRLRFYLLAVLLCELVVGSVHSK